MAEYIEREALLEKAWDADTRIGYVQVVDVWDIMDVPAADVVEVVRCKDCKHWHMTYKGNLVECHGYCHLEDADGTELSRWENDFCSYGERRADHEGVH